MVDERVEALGGVEQRRWFDHGFNLTVAKWCFIIGFLVIVSILMGFFLEVGLLATFNIFISPFNFI